MNISPTCQMIHDQLLQFPPAEHGYYEFPSCMIDKADLQIQHEYIHPKIDKLMAALPHFDVAPRHDDLSTLPWRVLWPFHPVIDTFGHTRYKLPADNPFLYPDNLNDAISETLPKTLEELRDYIVVEPKSRVVIYHREGPVRHRCAVFLGARMKGDIAPYFRTLWTRDENTPLPSPDTGLYATIQTKLHEAQEILLGRGRVMHKSTWEEHKKKFSINTPATAVPSTTSSPPPPSLQDTAAFPPVSKAPASKGRLGPPPKKAASVVSSYEAQTVAPPAAASATTPSLAPTVPALSLDSPMPEAAPAASLHSSPSAPISPHVASSPPAHTAPMTDITGPSPSPVADAAASPDVFMPQALPLKEQVEQSGTHPRRETHLPSTHYSSSHSTASAGQNTSSSNRIPSPSSHLCRSLLSSPLRSLLHGRLL